MKPQTTKKLKRFAIKWTNRYDCPPGYTFNEDGWVQTEEVYEKISVTILPHMLGKYSVVSLLVQNLIALYRLNPDTTHSTLVSALKYRSRKAFFNSLITDEVMEEVENVFGELSSLDDYYMDRSIIYKDNIFYAEWCEEAHRSKILYLIKHDAIDKTRRLMTVNTKYKTKHVAKDSGFSNYIVNKYWDREGLSRIMRSFSAVSEAMIKFEELGVTPTRKQLAEVSGVSLPTVDKALKEYNNDEE